MRMYQGSVLSYFCGCGGCCHCLAREGMLFGPDDLVLMGDAINEFRSWLLRWKGAFESEGWS